jgi:hypothetical protein
MITRWLPLYLRSRRVPLAVATSVAVIAVVVLLWTAGSDRSQVDPGLAALTVLLAIAPLIPTLVSSDDALEGTAALPWPPRRVLHLICAGGFVAVALFAVRGVGADFGPAWLIIRNSAGLAGLIGFAVALLGVRRAWVAPVAWSALQAMIAVPDGSGWQQTLFWLIQPVQSRPAAVTATVLLLAGVLAYAARVSPPTAPNEVEMGQ